MHSIAGNSAGGYGLHLLKVAGLFQGRPGSRIVYNRRWVGRLRKSCRPGVFACFVAKWGRVHEARQDIFTRKSDINPAFLGFRQ